MKRPSWFRLGHISKNEAEKAAFRHFRTSGERLRSCRLLTGCFWHLSPCSCPSALLPTTAIRYSRRRQKDDIPETEQLNLEVSTAAVR